MLLMGRRPRLLRLMGSLWPRLLLLIGRLWPCLLRLMGRLLIGDDASVRVGDDAAASAAPLLVAHSSPVFCRAQVVLLTRGRARGDPRVAKGAPMCFPLRAPLQETYIFSSVAPHLRARRRRHRHGPKKTKGVHSMKKKQQPLLAEIAAVGEEEEDGRLGFKGPQRQR